MSLANCAFSAAFKDCNKFPVSVTRQAAGNTLSAMTAVKAKMKNCCNRPSINLGLHWIFAIARFGVNSDEPTFVLEQKLGFELFVNRLPLLSEFVPINLGYSDALDFARHLLMIAFPPTVTASLVGNSPRRVDVKVSPTADLHFAKHEKAITQVQGGDVLCVA